jgi:hypothetical protein
MDDQTALEQPETVEDGEGQAGEPDEGTTAEPSNGDEARGPTQYMVLICERGDDQAFRWREDVVIPGQKDVVARRVRESIRENWQTKLAAARADDREVALEPVEFRLVALSSWRPAFVVVEDRPDDVQVRLLVEER